VNKNIFMADNKDRLAQNVPGRWYVDSNCIDCDLCRETAPTVFRRDDDGGYSIVFHQPETEEELRLAEEARNGCPVEAIGNDGPPATTEAKPSNSMNAA
jgi:ferredoxin